MAIYRDKDGVQIYLGDKIGHGGEADVYFLKNDNSQVVKIYNDAHQIDSKKHNKLKMMCDLYDDKIAQYYSWPKKIIYSSRKPVGFIMNNLNNSASDSEYIKIINFYNAGARKKYFPNAEYKFLVHSALNFACAVDALHKKDIVIGDINESNIFVNNKNATIKLIDCDSYQIENYSADVGKPEFIAPELPDHLKGVIRTQNHDCFSLAIVIFLILVGKHPYSYAGMSLSFREAIVQHLYCYGSEAQNKGLESLPPYIDIYNLLNPEIKTLFERAFNSKNRPSASDWIKVLKRYERQLVKCDFGCNHWYNPQYQSCIWCDLEENGFFAFGNGVSNVAQIQHGYDVANDNGEEEQNKIINNQNANFNFLVSVLKGIGWGFCFVFGLFLVIFDAIIGFIAKSPKIFVCLLALALFGINSHIKSEMKTNEDKNLYTEEQKQETIVEKNNSLTKNNSTSVPVGGTINDVVELAKNSSNNVLNDNPVQTSGNENVSPKIWETYMEQVERKIKANWHPIKDEKAKKIVVFFSIAKDGRLISSKIIQSSGDLLTDNIALESIKMSAPFKPLPVEFKGESVPIEFTFDYNVINKKNNY